MNLRRLLRARPPLEALKVTSDAAERIARNYLVERGFEVKEPTVTSRWDGTSWRFMTEANWTAGNLCVTVDGYTGEVLDIGVRGRGVLDDDIVGIAADLGSGLLPVNGLRHPPHGTTSGWYLWAGETFPEADDAFQPLHVKHLHDRCSAVLSYLSLPPGTRFLLAPGHEDLWFDESLL